MTEVRKRRRCTNLAGRAIPFAIGLLTAILITCQNVHADTLTEESAHRFLLALCAEDSSLSTFIDPNEARFSERFGIHYDGVPVKLLIGQVLDSTTRSCILSDSDYAHFAIDTLDGSYQRLSLACPDGTPLRDYYFQNGKLVLPSTCLSRNWDRFESPHFRFIFSDSTLINAHCIEQLEEFFSRTAADLDYTATQLDLLQREKIEYLLCRDPQEVATLTGYDSRGMYELSSDRIITCYNAHYHELVHLMVNLRLQQLPLRTHPFLQEGIAVALGGRGGIDRRVLAEMAAYLIASGTAAASDLLSTDGFNQTNATISYPVSGLYCSFLLADIGPEKFLTLYRKYSGSQDEIASMTIPAADLPPDSLWPKFVAHAAGDHFMDAVSSDSGFVEIHRDSTLIVSASGDRFLFKSRGNSLIGRNDSLRGYVSSICAEQFAGRRFRGERYAVIANANEIKIYDLYTNNLIANLIGAFRMPPVQIRNDAGFYSFIVAKSVFSDDLGRQLDSMK